jgi:hypothetical protein
VPQLAALLGRTTFTNEPLLRRVINANLRLGTKDAADRLSAFAADPANPEALRVEAVAALGVWADPSPLDRVDGFYLDGFEVPQAPGVQQPRRLDRESTGAVRRPGGGQPAPTDLSVGRAGL